jgi:SAM-dependent methyltransferase
MSTVMLSPGPQTSGVTYEHALARLKRVVRDLPPYSGDRVPVRVSELAAFLEQAVGFGLRGKEIADLGTGYGAPLLWMCLEGGARRGLGIERSPQGAEALELVVEELGIPGVSVHRADFHTYEPDATFDLVTVIDLAADRRIGLPALIGLMARMTKPGGIALIKGANLVYRPGGSYEERGHRAPQSQLLPRDAADAAESYFTDAVPGGVMHAPAAVAGMMRATGFADAAFAWANGAHWRETGAPARTRPCLPHYYVAARRTGRHLRVVR